MDLKLKSEIKEIFYWECKVEKHRHKTKEFAEICLKRNNPQTKKLTYEQRYIRNVNIVKYIIDGNNQKQAAEKFNLSMTTIFNTLNRILRSSRHPLNKKMALESGVYGLSYERPVGNIIKGMTAHKEQWDKYLDGS